MILLRAFPLLALVIAAYCGLMIYGSAGLDVVVGHVALPSGARWNVTTGDSFLIVGLALLFVEMVSSGSRLAAMVNHVLSLVLLVVCIGLFLLVPACGTNVFILLTLMAMVDVLAGYIGWLRQAHQARRHGNQSGPVDASRTSAAL